MEEDCCDSRMVDEQKITCWEVTESRWVHGGGWSCNCDAEDGLEGELEDAAITSEDYAIDVGGVFRCEGIADDGTITVTDVDA